MKFLSIFGVVGVTFAFANPAAAINLAMECSFQASKILPHSLLVNKLNVSQSTPIANMTLAQLPNQSYSRLKHIKVAQKTTPPRLLVKTSTSTKSGRNDSVEKTGPSQGVFNSVRLAFGNIKTKKDWDRIRASEISDLAKCPGNNCSVTLKEIKELKHVIRNKPFFEKLKRVNTTINRIITYREDKRVYQKADYWALPNETARYGLGDCEDFATLKMNLLKNAGVPETSMSLVVLLDTKRNLHHAVLAIATNKGNFILDNMHDKVLIDKEIADYKPLYSFSEDRSWLHGFKRNGTSPKPMPPISSNENSIGEYEKTSSLDIELGSGT